MEKLIVIRDNQKLQELIDYLSDKTYTSVDTETTGVDRDSLVVGISVCADVETAYYVILSYWDTTESVLKHLETRQGLEPLLSLLKTKQLLMHNAVFDCQMIHNNFSINLIESLHTDTMILGHLLDENRHNGLKELGVSIFGEDATKEQREMKESVVKNGGVLTKDKYELYKADPELLAKYGAKDALLTLKLFYEFVEKLYEEGLDKFFYEEESMPMLKGPTYELNTTGLRVDPDKLMELRRALEVDCMEAKAFIHKEIYNYVKEKYPATKENNTFNIGSGNQLAWLLYEKLGEEFDHLTDSGKEICAALGMKIPYTKQAKREFIQTVKDNIGRICGEAKFNPKTKKMSRPKKVGDPWKYLGSDAVSLTKLAPKYAFVRKILEHAKNTKLLSTYVLGIQARVRYNIIHPSFLQHGTTSGRYSSRNPNFQNLPRGDKRVKSCIVSRPTRVFVGADYSQLEPRVFASVSEDATLLNSFKEGKDFYSVVGAPIFGITGCSMFKNDPDSFAKKHEKLRDKAKVLSLATPYGRTAYHQASAMGISRDEAQDLIDRYFAEYPKVELMMLESHEQVKAEGQVLSIFGRPRRIPEAKEIRNIYGDASHAELPYVIRTKLNLAMNHKVQSTGASIVNRASIAFYHKIRALGIKECHIVLQVHDELVIECFESDSIQVAEILKDCMENTTKLPGVDLIAEPKIAKNLADLK